ncbi:MAG: hypothetical protein FJ096_03490 [Deltaproteobacteria bacterium]|nr:hypothetical protein [Deltaproteobacteria bacterium]
MSPPSTPEPAPSAVLVRPPEGLARGRYPVQGWVIVAAAATLLAAALAFTVLRGRRALRSRDANATPTPGSDR